MRKTKDLISGGTFIIVANYLPATNSRGSRVKAYRSDFPKESVVVSWDYSYDRHENYDVALTEWIKKYETHNGHKWLNDSYSFIRGFTKTGYIYTAFCNAK